METSYYLTAQNRFWQIEELVDSVLSLNEWFSPENSFLLCQTDLVSLARVNSFVGSVALKQIWKSLNSLKNLIHIIPSSLLQLELLQTQDPDIKETLVNGLSRYLSYSELVEELWIYSNDPVLKIDGLLAFITILVRISGQEARHFRRLRHLNVDKSGSTRIGVILAYCAGSQTLKNVTLELNEDLHRPIIDDFVERHVPNCLPRVQVLRFNGDLVFTNKLLWLSVMPALSQLPDLHILDIRLTLPAARSFLSYGTMGCTALTLHISSVRDDEQLMGNQYDLSEHPIQPRSDPRNLRGTGFDRTVPVITLNVATKPIFRLQEINFSVEQLVHFQELNQLCKEAGFLLRSMLVRVTRMHVISSISQTLTICATNFPLLERFEYRDTWTPDHSQLRAMEPDLDFLPEHLSWLSNFSNLRYLHFNCKLPVFVTEEFLFEISHKFPHLEYLHFNPYDLTAGGRHRVVLNMNLRLVSLYGALRFASTCPKLRYLSIRVDACKPLTFKVGNEEIEGIVASSLQTLSVAASHMDDVDYVESLLRLSCPSLEQLFWYKIGINGTVILSGAECIKWSMVESRLLPQKY
ncbi:hypothetical protein FRC14_004742 [Serendipita sp. 396]|nr:hypothetical protein FRC14_004742 [Serendipita sp. 396]KAG8789377.1 hypothetical protein FRC15_009429 [Serendipita sp. 397]KAG8804609.1 hypothetical protein FRC16_006051 [Serendipita sp. 398]KAG8878731.1 hypothetical protein FRC20_006408 [Serendipita sp. 405]